MYPKLAMWVALLGGLGACGKKSSGSNSSSGAGHTGSQTTATASGTSTSTATATAQASPLTAADLAATAGYTPNTLGESDMVTALQGIKEFYYNPPNAGAASDCDTELDTLKATATAGNLVLSGSLDLTACSSQEEAAQQVNVTSDSFQIYLNVTCTGGDLSVYNGKGLIDLPPHLADICASGTALMGSKEVLKTTQLDKQGQTLTEEQTYINLEGKDATTGCPYSSDGKTFTYDNSCIALYKTDTSATDGSAATTNTEDLTKLTYAGVASDLTSKTHEWMTAGTMSVTLDNWQGTVTFTGSTTAPKFSMTPAGGAAVSGDLSVGATFTATGVPDSAAHLVLDVPDYPTAGACMPVYVLRLTKDNAVNFDVPVYTDHDLAITFALDTTTLAGTSPSATLYTDAACTTTGSGATLKAGDTTAVIYVKTSASSTGSYNVDATFPAPFAGAADSSPQARVDFTTDTAVAAPQIAFGDNFPAPVALGTCSLAGYNTSAPATADITLTLSFSAGTDAKIYADPSCTTPATTAVIKAGTTWATFFVEDATLEDMSLAATAAATGTTQAPIQSVDYGLPVDPTAD